MTPILSDLKFAFRRMRKTPGLTAIVILTLAIGIGANTIVFSWISSILFHPLPGVEDTDRMVVVVQGNPNGQDDNTVSYPDLRDLAVHKEVFAGAAGVQGPRILNLKAHELNAWIWAEPVTPGLFSFLGIRPLLGRAFLPEEEGLSGNTPAVILSHKLWRMQLGSDPNIIGKAVQLNRLNATIVGVMPPQFKGMTNGLSLDLWITVPMTNQLRFSSTLDNRANRAYYALARLQPGVTLTQAQAVTRAVSRHLEAAYPESNRNYGMRLVSLLDCPYGAQGSFSKLFSILLFATLLLLVIIIANVANLLLAQASSRYKEIAIRLTIGAGRARLIRQFLLESWLLALAGGMLGILFAIWGRNLLSFFSPKTYLPLDLSELMKLNWHVLVYALAITFLTGFGFGIVPALQNFKTDLNSALKEGGRYSSGASGTYRLSGLLGVAETALAVVVLIGAALCCKSFKSVLDINPGFDPKNLLLAGIQLSAGEYDENHGRAFYRRLLERIRGMAGIEGACLGSWAQLGFEDTGAPAIEVEGYQPRIGENMGVHRVFGSRNYLETMRIPLVEGRHFQSSDTRDSNKVVIINETMAKRFWPGTTALGKRIRGGNTFFTVVGIAKDGKYTSLRESPQPFMYFDYEQTYYSNMMLHVRSYYNSPTLLAAIQKEIRVIDPNVKIAAVFSMLDLMDSNYYAQRILATLLTVLGLLALLLASLGIYGILSWSVSRRIMEIGIRMALGASTWEILKMVILKGSRLMLVGITIGIAIASFLIRHLAAFLVGVKPHDPLIYSAVCGFLLLIGLLACYLPARRAANLNPLVVLKGG